MKMLIVIFLIAMVFTQQVQHSNRCNDCAQLKSQNDCEQEVTVTGACEWVAASGTTAAKCEKKTTVDPSASFKPYCELVDKPEAKCSKTFGCAYVDSKCTHFAGCSAYVQSTTANCQAISYFCVSDGIACIEAKECKDYTQAQCESTPSISGILKCKWDTNSGACRDFSCSEADSSLNTDAKCSDWLAGCVTKGQGCVNTPRPACATYTGDDTACKSFIGSDGNCELAAGTTNCKAKECANAPTSLSTDDDCKAYQTGCITTGKGCVLAIVKPLCSTYSGDNTTCVGFIGSDGVCEGDAGGSKCRARKCENGAFNTDELCKQYQSSCRTNGKTCVSALAACNTYKGTATSCAIYIGTDGLCKGTSTTTEASCLPKVCDEAPDTTTTDDACNKYQTGCVTTGKGCVTKINLKSCTTYEGDTTSCQARVGSEGKCTWKSGTKCVARDCTAAASNVNTNPLCANYFTNCVTTGSGCVPQTSCDQTLKQQSCEGTSNCSWQPICNSNKSCSEYKKKAICLANQARVQNLDKYDDQGNPVYSYVPTKCGWLNGACKNLDCSDLTGVFYNTDTNCTSELPQCISNRVDACITKYDCSKLFGTQSTCLSYPAYCTNTASATDTTACVSRKCSDNTDATDNATCNTFLPGCITSGQGCVDYNTPCTSLKGTQATCDKLYAYLSGTSSNFLTNQCYNSSSATATDYCKVKTCALAEGQTDSTCGSFLDGCVYNGNGGCVDPKTATCGSYTGVAAFCEIAVVGSNGAKYCFGTSTSGTCKTRACTDNTTATKDDECESFMTGCIAKSEGGCIDKSRACTLQNGTLTTCPTFSGGLLGVKVPCTRYDACQERRCAEKTNPQQASDCTDYKTTCRFLKSGVACIDVSACSNYNTPDTATTDQQKFDYCTSIKSYDLLCGWSTGTKCADRTCDQLLSTNTNSAITCANYLQKGISTYSANTCKLAGNYCYLPNKSDCTYDFPTAINTDTLKLTQCQKYVDTSGIFCSFKTGDPTCTAQDTCEKMISQISTQVCNDLLGFEKGICQKVANAGCLTTQKLCSSYNLDSTLSDANKKIVCESLKVVDDDTKFGDGARSYRGCTWTSGNICNTMTCASVASAVSQRDCDSKVSGCYYYAGKCNSAVAAGTCPTSFPADVDTDTKKAKYCKSVYETGIGYCEIKADGTGCKTPTNTNCVLTFASAWTATNFDGVAAASSAFCPTQSNKDKSKYCILDGSDATKCKAGTCEDIPSPTSQGDCDLHLLGCVFSATKCRTPKIVGVSGDCADTSKVPFGSEVSGLSDASQKTAYCQIFSKDGLTVFCTYDQYNGTTQTKCVAAGNCDTYTTLPSGDAAISTYCLSKINGSGAKCAFTAGASKCRDFDCYDIVGPTSQIDCDINGVGLKCVYYGRSCVNKSSKCVAVPAVGATTTEKQNFCANIKVNERCIYIIGNNCSKFEYECEYYDVTAATDKVAACTPLTDVGGFDCTFMQGSKCIKVQGCQHYDGTTTAAKGPEAGQEDAQCRAIISRDGYKCIKDSAQKCRMQACSDNDANATDCAHNAPNCIYYQNKCFTKDDCENYTPQGSDNAAKQIWCEGVQSYYKGILCAWDSGSSKCKERACSDKSFYTDFDCQSYLSTCKTNGTTCVDKSTNCNAFHGSSDFCNSLTDSTGNDKCGPIATASTSTSACSNRTCYDNVIATSDSDCDSYLSGCVTRGVGCIPNTEPCTSYRGTKQQCEAFKKYTGLDANKNPTYEYCSGDAANTATSKCKVRTCGDNITATSDTECAAYLKGCVTKGTGCIEPSSLCTGYKGDQAGCSKFKGNTGADYCWNTTAALATANCAKKKCSDISGKNNKDCSDGMPPFKTTDNPFCVFDGTGCIDYGKSCTTFQGTEETCPTYLASDGPCKATTVGTIKGACAKRVCTEAPNTLATDADCKKYHPSCYTTGYGCTAVKLCSNLTNQASCNLREECTWANQCTNSITTCATYSNTSYSQCTNSKVNGKYCAWTESTSTCRAQICEDQLASITTHKQCQDFADTCTTNGAGCITITLCSSYKSQSICLAASTTKDGVGRCGWDTLTNKCRSRVCSDKNGLTDDECNTFLAGCKTNGTGCVSGTSCTEFLNKQFCLTSNRGPCLWVNGSCYDYDRCEDAIKKTHLECQAFSPLCTTNGDTCIPITSCTSTTLKASCVVGTDGACGWLPTGKCQKFGQCTDAVAATNDECLSYGSACITDGTACIAKSTCGSYKTQTSCNNLGTDGICYWNATTNICKLKECGDEQKGTNDQCKLISVTGTPCTTDGTKCVPVSTCSTYVEAGCYNGTDGECIFALPIGAAATATKTCRLKQCEDITGGTSNANCMGIISGKACVSNGTSCIAKAACSTYKTITACNGGGFENNKSIVCAFTPTGTDKVNGTCKAFSACADATKDKLACTTNPSCKWTENSTGTSCVNHACDTYATGTDCQPLPSFDGASSTICVLQSGKCAAANPGTMTDPKICYTKSAYTYSWNTATSKCESCTGAVIVTPNNSNLTNNTTNLQTTDSAYILSAISFGLLGLFA